MKNITDKVDNTAGAIGRLPAVEYNDHKNELQNAVSKAGQTLAEGKTPEQLARSMFIYAIAAESVVDSGGSANSIILSPLTGSNGLVAPDEYAQMEGATLCFTKAVANTSSTVTINFGQNGVELGAKNLFKIDGSTLDVGEVQGSIKVRFDLPGDRWLLIPASYDSLNIGKIYIQYPGKPTPVDFYGFGTWSNISSSYPGDYFRVEGGNASAFDSGEQADAFQGFQIGATNDPAGAQPYYQVITTRDRVIASDPNTAFGIGNFSKTAQGVINQVKPVSNGTNGTPRIASETRSINHTIRIWELTSKG